MLYQESQSAGYLNKDMVRKYMNDHRREAVSRITKGATNSLLAPNILL